jgi:hypothetical protein
MSVDDIALLAFCPVTRRFGISAASTRVGGAAPRFVSRPWRGMVYSLGRDLSGFARLGALLEQGWRGEGLLGSCAPDADPHQVVCTIDSIGRFATRVGPSAQRNFYRASRQSVHAITLGHAGADVAFQMLDAFEAAGDAPIPERLLKGLEVGITHSHMAASSAFIHVLDPDLEYAYTDVTVDLDTAPVSELRRAHDWLSPLYDYYALRGQDPTVPRYPQWLAQRRLQEAKESA